MGEKREDKGGERKEDKRAERGEDKGGEKREDEGRGEKVGEKARRQGRGEKTMEEEREEERNRGGEERKEGERGELLLLYQSASSFENFKNENEFIFKRKVLHQTLSLTEAKCSAQLPKRAFSLS